VVDEKLLEKAFRFHGQDLERAMTLEERLEHEFLVEENGVFRRFTLKMRQLGRAIAFDKTGFALKLDERKKKIEFLKRMMRFEE